MNMRSMEGPRRVDSRWPQTDLMDRRRSPRTKDNPYRRQQRNANGKHPSDYVVLALFAGVCLWLWWKPIAAWWDALMAVAL
jgi:hypothetical protein